MDGSGAARPARAPGRTPPGRLLAAALPALLAALLPAGARADGPGVLVGDAARLHFSLDLETRFDSLAGQGFIGNVTHPVFDPADFILHLRSGVKLAAPGERTDFDAGAALDWSKFTGWLAPTTDLSYLGASANATLEMGKGGPVGLRVAETFSRSDRTTNPALGIGSITDSNALGARLALRPGGGAIEAGVGYDFGVEAYELKVPAPSGLCPAGTSSTPSCDGSAYGGFGSQTHRFSIDGRWRFLPKTALLLGASWALRFYEGSTGNVPTRPLRIEGGLAGLLTEKVRILIRGGWAKTFADSQREFSGAIGQLELGWNPSETAGVSAGLLRTVEPVSDTYGWYDDWRGYLGGRLVLAGRLQLTATANLDRISFANLGRTDTQTSLDAAAEVEILRLLHAMLGCLLTSRDSSSGGVFNYQRTEVYLRLALAY